MKNNRKYQVKKGPADPFRGDWYIGEDIFDTAGEAINKAAELTLAEYEKYRLSWEEFGYEWSVFENDGTSEKKIWEGYKYIQCSGNNRAEFTSGNVP